MKRVATLFIVMLSCAVSARAVVSAATPATASSENGDSSTALNKITARRVFLEIFNQGKYDVAKDIYAPDFVNHGLTTDANLAQDQAAVHGWREAVPDLVMTVLNEVAEGDLVSVLWVGTGTNTGTGNGYSATGKRMTMRGITIWRFVNGKIREEWSEFSMPVAGPR
jgi:predicted ester cyclase